MIKAERQARAARRYSVYEAGSFGAVREAAVLEACSDLDALKQARSVLPDRPGELRQGSRLICRFGRAPGFMLGS